MVEDADTGKLLPDARVSFWVRRAALNWIPPMSYCIVYDPSDPSGSPFEQGTNQLALLLRDAMRARDGVFRLRARTRLCWAHVLFPIGLPLGGVLLRTYDGGITAWAPGHLAVSFSDSLGSLPNDEIAAWLAHPVPGLPVSRAYVRKTKEGVRIGLPRKQKRDR